MGMLFKPDSPGFRILYPTRWTARAACVESILENWDVLRELCSQSLETKLDPEVKSRITGARYQMETFDFYFGVQLSNLVLRHSGNLSKTIQKPTLSAGDVSPLNHSLLRQCKSFTVMILSIYSGQMSIPKLLS